MTDIHHHPSEATMFRYGGGTLGEGLSLAVASHLDGCALCRAIASDIDAIGGLMLAELAPTPLERVSAEAVANDAVALPRLPPIISAASSPDPAFAFLPRSLRTYLGDSLAGRPWRQVVPGIEEITIIPRSRSGGVQLLRIAAGVSLPLHTHDGIEFTQIFTGSYRDEIGRFGPGDFSELDQEINHRPVAEAECIGLIATDAPLRYPNLIARLMRPFLRF